MTRPSLLAKRQGETARGNCESADQDIDTCGVARGGAWEKGEVEGEGRGRRETGRDRENEKDAARGSSAPGT